MKNQNKSHSKKLVGRIIKVLAATFALIVIMPLLFVSIYSWQHPDALNTSSSETGIQTARANLFNIQLAHAKTDPPATPAAAPKTSDMMQDMYNKISASLAFIIALLQKFMWPVLLLIGGLMRNDILFGGGMEERLLLIWTNVRNLVNIMFVLVLLAIALYNVLGLKNQEFQIKTIMPKFVIALIAVNFSFIGLKVVIDSINVVSTAIFAMPDVIEANLSKPPPLNYEEQLCYGMYGKDNNGIAMNGKMPDTENSLCKRDSATSPPKLDPAKSGFLKKFSGQSFAVFMAISFQKIADLNQVKVNENGGLRELSMNMAFSMIFTIVYGTAFIALFVVLLGRLVVLWISLALCPLVALKMVLPQKMQQSIMGGGEMDLQSIFVKNAIAPIPIALVMTIGYIMMKALNSAAFTDPAKVGSTMGLNFLSSGLSTLQELIIAAATTIFVWKGVFAAANGTVAKGITGQLQKGVEGIGKFAANSWQYLPLIPGKEGEKGYTIAGVLGAAGNIENRIKDIGQKDKDRIEKEWYGKSTEDTIKSIKGAKDAKEALAFYEGASAMSSEDDRKRMQKELYAKLKDHHEGLTFFKEDGTKGSWEDFAKSAKEGNATVVQMQNIMRENGIQGKATPDKVETADEKKKREAEEKKAAANQPPPQNAEQAAASKKKSEDAEKEAVVPLTQVADKAKQTPPATAEAKAAQTQEAAKALADGIIAINKKDLTAPEKKAAIDTLLEELKYADLSGTGAGTDATQAAAIVQGAKTQIAQENKQSGKKAGDQGYIDTFGANLDAGRYSGTPAAAAKPGAGAAPSGQNPSPRGSPQPPQNSPPPATHQDNDTMIHPSGATQIWKNGRWEFDPATLVQVSSSPPGGDGGSNGEIQGQYQWANGKWIPAPGYKV